MGKFQSFPSPSSNIVLSVTSSPSSLSEPSLWSTSTIFEDAQVTSTNVKSPSVPDFPPLRRSKAMSIPSRSFSILTIAKTCGVKRLLESASSSSSIKNNETKGLFESSPSEGLEMEICQDCTALQQRTRRRISKPSLKMNSRFPL